ncbi:BAZ1A [Cordylochernes scorpioides]|uniref:BAZ1A n=1 Tax=Cordylochernes scorpioides TaxID=51811 RepID=A0ABY6L0S8_9ARAC|nr:BAZ1A [Cordylochernes scorpioides]
MKGSIEGNYKLFIIIIPSTRDTGHDIISYHNDKVGAEDKLKILLLLLDQILLLDHVKDAIEENVVKLKNLENELRHLQLKYAKNEKRLSVKSLNDLKDTLADREKLQKEKAKRTEEFQKKEKELKSQIYKLRASACQTPIGRDRAYRMFYIFNSVPGLFVAHEDTLIGECLPKSSSKLMEDMPLIVLKKYYKVTGELISGKENEAILPLSTLKHRNNLAGKQQTVLNPKLNSNVATSPQPQLKQETEEDRKASLLSSAMLCTGCVTTCSIHNLQLPGRVQWAFYSTETELSNLAANLSPRGLRENHLRKQLEQGYLAEFIKDCPIHRLNKAYPAPLQPELRKSSRNQLRYESEFANMEPREALESTFCDLILELEEKISVASLGHLQVPDRAEWRTSLEEQFKYSETDPDTPPSQEDKKPQQSLSSCVATLSRSLLQVAQAVEPRFLRPPLGETEEFKKKKTKYQNELAKYQKGREETDKNISDLDFPQIRVSFESAPTKMATQSLQLVTFTTQLSTVVNVECVLATEENGGVEIPAPVPPKSTLELWSESLQGTSSLSQLFVHLYTLETSVAWDRSLLKVSCKVCRRKGDSDSMLLCEGCDRGYHTHCLKPPLKEVSPGSWFCQTCRPKEEVPTSPRKRTAILDEEDELDDQYSDNQSSEEYDDEEDDSEDSNDDVCDKCHKGGTLMCCDNCPLAFHLECTDLRRIPRGTWHCPKCISKAQKRRASTQPAAAEKVPAKKAKIEETSSSKRRSAATDVDFNYVSCDEMIEALFKHQDSWPFRRAVTKRDAPDYFEIIKEPMDLGTVRHKLRSMAYHSNEEFLQDIWLTLDNCEAYNPQKSDEYKAGTRLRKKVKELEASLLGRAQTPPEPDNKRKRKSN